MLTYHERQPLRHLRGSQESLIAGALLFLAGTVLLIFGGQAPALLAMLAMGVGLAMALVSAYYWGCGNESCSPPDL
jgi:hypothetical protein